MFHAFAHDVTSDRTAPAASPTVEAAVSRGLAEAASSTAAAERVVQALGVSMGWPVAETVAGRRGPAGALPAPPGTPTADGGWATSPSTNWNPASGYPAGLPRQARRRWIPDLAADTGSLRSRAAARIGLRVAVGVPIEHRRHTLGRLCVYGDQVEDPEDTLIALLSGVAAQVGQYWNAAGPRS